MRLLCCAALVLSTAGAAPSHVRSSDPYIADLIAYGTARSSTFRGLVATLNASDVLVYVDWMHKGGKYYGAYIIDAVVSSGGYRYLRARLNRRGDREHMVAVLAHELQHAVEVATAQEVRNSETFRALFARIGISQSCIHTCETAAALRVQQEVARELLEWPDPSLQESATP